jgi:hypothetical protein
VPCRYKILFLDVLFPLGLKKVIYIDADQVVRSDIAELWDHDLKVRAPGRLLAPCAVRWRRAQIALARPSPSPALLPPALRAAEARQARAS